MNVFLVRFQTITMQTRGRNSVSSKVISTARVCRLFIWTLIQACLWTPCTLCKKGSPATRALARKLKLMTFSQNWGIRLVFAKRPHHDWQQICFVTTQRTLKNAILGKKYFRSWHYTTYTNHHWEIFFSLFIINLVGIWTRNK